MTTIDPISYSAAQIKAKASVAKTTKLTLKSSTLVMPDLPKGPHPTSVLSQRDSYLKSINAAALKKAANDMGLNIKFGLDPKNWIANNPHLKDVLPQIQAKAAEIVSAGTLDVSV